MARNLVWAGNVTGRSVLRVSMVLGFDVSFFRHACVGLSSDSTTIKLLDLNKHTARVRVCKSPTQDSYYPEWLPLTTSCALPLKSEIKFFFPELAQQELRL
jgi:hypothetical protein